MMDGKSKYNKKRFGAGTYLIVFIIAVPITLYLIETVKVTNSGGGLWYLFLLLELFLVVSAMIQLKVQKISSALQLAWALVILFLPIVGSITFLYLNPTEKQQ